MRSDLEALLGQPAFERARGVVMYLCSCDAEQAVRRMIKITVITLAPPEDLVDDLLTSSGRLELRNFLQPGAS